MSIKNILKNIRQNYKKDGALSWFVCFCAFLANATVPGVDYTFGEQFGSIMRDFNSSESSSALVGSVFSSTSYFASSVSSLLGERFGFAPVVAIGVLLSLTFFILATTSSSVSILTLHYGFFAGFGLGLIYTPSQIICSYHFIKNRSLATGIAISGSGIGIIAVSQSMNFISARYGWKGCVLICAFMSLLSSLLAIVAYILPEEYDEEHFIENDDSNKHVEIKK